MMTSSCKRSFLARDTSAQKIFSPGSSSGSSASIDEKEGAAQQQIDDNGRGRASEISSKAQKRRNGATDRRAI